MQISAEWLHTPASNAVMNALFQAGKKAYFVGGCVRNHLLDAPVADLDVSTDALPHETVKIMQNAGLKTVPTGIDHGTITVVSDGTPYEITTFRRDIKTDGRRAVVAFSTDIIDDARRRDFTMNALYTDKEGVIADPLNGLPDLLARRVRFIESAEQRIAEDYLRILRFFRFHAWYGDPAAGLDTDGLAACATSVSGIETLSKERIGAEMRKLLAAPDPAPALSAMGQTGALMRVLPGANPETLAPLIHLELAAGIAPCWQRRLAALGGENPMQNLRLSKTDTRHLDAVQRLITKGCSPAEAGYRYGKQVAIDAALVLAASLSTPVPVSTFAEIERGVAAVFPIKAKDLQPRYSGQALGNALKKLESRWIASGLRAQRYQLLD
ncbi:MAG: CCA tRNA nucleotidyltransferase [Rhodobacteraceae bacterium]|nr:CCA tRNA nucleotidyltransferase [Paracoccaceae bacterium]